MQKKQKLVKLLSLIEEGNKTLQMMILLKELEELDYTDLQCKISHYSLINQYFEDLFDKISQSKHIVWIKVEKLIVRLISYC